MIVIRLTKILVIILGYPRIKKKPFQKQDQLTVTFDNEFTVDSLIFPIIYFMWYMVYGILYLTYVTYALRWL